MGWESEQRIKNVSLIGDMGSIRDLGYSSHGRFFLSPLSQYSKLVSQVKGPGLRSPYPKGHTELLVKDMSKVYNSGYTSSKTHYLSVYYKCAILFVIELLSSDFFIHITNIEATMRTFMDII